MKKNQDTALKVEYDGDFRICCCVLCCKRSLEAHGCGDHGSTMLGLKPPFLVDRAGIHETGILKYNLKFNSAAL